MTNKSGANGHYGYLFEEPVDEISGDILIDLENLPPEMKQTILLLVKNAADRDAAQKALSNIMKQIEFDVTAAELAAYLFKPGTGCATTESMESPHPTS